MMLLRQDYWPGVSRLIALPKSTVGTVIMLVGELPLISYNTHMKGEGLLFQTAVRRWNTTLEAGLNNRAKRAEAHLLTEGCRAIYNTTLKSYHCDNHCTFHQDGSELNSQYTLHSYSHFQVFDWPEPPWATSPFVAGWPCLNPARQLQVGH